MVNNNVNIINNPLFNFGTVILDLEYKLQFQIIYRYYLKLALQKIWKIIDTETWLSCGLLLDNKVIHCIGQYQLFSK